MSRLALWLLGAVARLPLGVLYLFADIIFVILYYIVRYRRKVVRKNIVDSFPDMDPHEVDRTVRQFYRNLADYIVETLKVGRISDAEIKRRMQFEGMEIIDRLADEGRSVTAYFSHCGNWEWVPSITLWSRRANKSEIHFCQVYRPLRNRFFDSLMLHLRSRFGSLSFKKSTVFRDLLRLRRDGLPIVTGFMSDQKPSHGDPVHVLVFLNHPTAVITGTETLSRKLNDAVVYFDMHKLGRGRYKVVIRLITDDIDSLPQYSVTDRYVAMLEETIRRNPSIWLWSHKRWKHPVTLNPQPK